MRTAVGAVGACWLVFAACTPPPPSTAQAAPEATPEATSKASDSSRAAGWVAKTLPVLAAALAAREVSSETLVQAYLARIDAVDRAGPTLQSVLTLNPDALTQARAIDAQRAAGTPLGALAGVPILLKDNIESRDPMPTTAGAVVLKHNVTGRDSPLVAGLRAQGAIILGKTNLSQWANFRSRDSISGWSALGGQVRNPHMLDRSPCGSSSGSGAAVAASLAAGAVGTETNGSIICPAHMNGVVGFKPTVGLVSQQYIVPISMSQDTAGPMTRTVRGAAMMLNAMATGDGKRADYVAWLDADALRGKRVGVLRFAVGKSSHIERRFDAALDDLANAGAQRVEIAAFEPEGDDFWGDALSVLEYEFKAGLDAYLSDTPPTVTARTLADVIAFNQRHAAIELALFGHDLFESASDRGPLTEAAYVRARAAVQSATRERGIDALLAKHRVDMLVAPSGPLAARVDAINGDVWPAWAGAGYLAAIAGYPQITVPMGDVHGVPVGLSIIGARDTDADILAYGYAYEQVSHKRVEPMYLPDAEARPDIARAMRPSR